MTTHESSPNSSSTADANKNALITEQYEWLENEYDSNIDIDDLISWIVVDEKKSTITNEKDFCDGKLLDELVSMLFEMDSLTDTQLDGLKKRCNPFEGIGRSIFVDRNSVKLANIDSLLNNMITQPLNQRKESLIKSNETFTFAALDKGSGGFIDYIQWRRGWHAKGYAFVMRPIPHLNRFASESHSFKTFFGSERDAEFTHPNNVKTFIDYVKRYLPNGVHIVFNDTVIPINRGELKKEIISKRLYLISCAFALCACKKNGHFIMKMFTHLTPFTVGLIYIMYKCFHSITIIKPYSCRPANSERYLICKWKKSNTDDIMQHLLEINETMMQLDDNVDVTELVSMDVLKNDVKFFQYIFNTNNAMLSKQIHAKKTMLKFHNDFTLNILDDHPLGKTLREKCLKLWKIPDNQLDEITTLMELTKIKTPDDYIKEICPLFDRFNLIEHDLSNESNLSMEFSTPRLWHTIAIENNDTDSQTFYLCCGRTNDNDNLYQYNKNLKQWQLITDYKIMLPKQTLIYGEILTVYDDHKNNSYKCLQIIDCYVLEGEQIYEKSYLERSTICHKYVSCIGKNNSYTNKSGINIISIESQMKKSLLTIDMILKRLKSDKIVIDGKNVMVQFLGKNSRYFIPNGLIFVHDIDCYQSRRIWKWTDDEDKIDEVFENKLLDYVKPFSSSSNENRHRHENMTDRRNGRRNHSENRNGRRNHSENRNRHNRK